MSPPPLPSLVDEAWRLEPFIPPFVFSAFFSPEDTLLCACAADAALDVIAAPLPKTRDLLPSPTPDSAHIRITELTSGSGLVGLALLRHHPTATLLGLDIDPQAASIAERNAESLGLAQRARFATSDLWSSSTIELLTAERPQLLVCNPPYVPEPTGMCMQIEAGAGPHGTAHLLRALELARDTRPDALALSWCSLADPARVMAAVESAGYQLVKLFVTAIADGEYSGSVHSYLRALGDCYITDQPETLSTLGPDGSARFGYLLLAGALVRSRAPAAKADRIDRNAGAAGFIQKLCKDFARDGIGALSKYTAANGAPCPVQYFVLDRWGELELRVRLHGPAAQSRAEAPLLASRPS